MPFHPEIPTCCLCDLKLKALLDIKIQELKELNNLIFTQRFKKPEMEFLMSLFYKMID